MAKKQWVDGSNLTPAEMTAYWGSDSITGHTHGGLDQDGSVPKITLSGGTHVDGSLPLTYLLYYESGTVDVHISTSYLTIDAPATIHWERLGKRVNIHMTGGISGISNSTQLKLSLVSGVWPSGMLPGEAASYLYIPITIINDGQFTPAVVVMNPTSTVADWEIQIFTSGVYSATGFLATGTKGFTRLSFGYTRA